MAIRVVLAEDHYLVREGVRRLLETRPDLEVAAVCGDLDSLLAAVDAERPDVVVTDIRMPPEARTRGFRPPRGCARRTRTSASSSSASTRARATRSRCWSTEARAGRTS